MKTGIQVLKRVPKSRFDNWTPAYAGVTALFYDLLHLIIYSPEVIVYANH